MFRMLDQLMSFQILVPSIESGWDHHDLQKNLMHYLANIHTGSIGATSAFKKEGKNI